MKTLQLTARIPENFMILLDELAERESKDGRRCNRTDALLIVLTHGLMTIAKKGQPKVKR